MKAPHHIAPFQMRRVLIIAAIVWTIPALFFSTLQYRELLDTEKQMTWPQAVWYQAPSWLMLIPLTPIVFLVVRRWPLQIDSPRRIVMHVATSVAFGLLFLLIAVPVRNLVHPAPVQWKLFGAAVYKSAPQFAVIGAFAYWAIAIFGSLIETRLRLYAVLDAPPVENDADAAAHLVLTTPGGKVQLPATKVLWIEPAAGGAKLHTEDDALLIRHSLTDLETLLPGGFVRVHRSYTVNAEHAREITGPPSRDGQVRLADGSLIPVSRRRRSELDDCIAATVRR